MHGRKVGEKEYLVVLEKEERVVANLLQFAEDQGIEGGWVAGLGSLRDIELGYYDLPRRTYLRREFEEDMELTGFQGNFGMAGKVRVLHVHATLSGPELISFSGHLFEATVAVTTEFHVRDFGVRIDLEEVPEVGLKLIRPPAGAGPAGGAKTMARGRKKAGRP